MNVNARGQVTIPKHIRQAAGLSPGSKVRFSIEGHCIVITPEPRVIKADRRAALRAAAARVRASLHPAFRAKGADEILAALRSDLPLGGA